MKLEKTACRNGHEKTEDSWYIDVNGRGRCRYCRQATQKRAKAYEKKIDERYNLALRQRPKF